MSSCHVTSTLILQVVLCKRPWCPTVIRSAGKKGIEPYHFVLLTMLTLCILLNPHDTVPEYCSSSKNPAMRRHKALLDLRTHSFFVAVRAVEMTMISLRVRKRWIFKPELWVASQLLSFFFVSLPPDNTEPKQDVHHISRFTALSCNRDFYGCQCIPGTFLETVRQEDVWWIDVSWRCRATAITTLQCVSLLSIQFLDASY